VVELKWLIAGLSRREERSEEKRREEKRREEKRREMSERYFCQYKETENYNKS